MKAGSAISRDEKEVIEAADLLDTSEFNLFSIAYRRWYGRHSDERTLERYFAAYMFRSVVPPWVRYLAREIRAKAREGTLRLADYGLVRRPLSARMLLRGRIYSGILLIVCLLLLLASLYYEDLVLVFGNCYFPPCY